MDDFDNMRRALDYIEANLTGDIDYETAARIALCSSYHFQRMFAFLVGVPPSEYIRRRRLTLAAFDLQNSERILDIAVKYGYTSADAFARAFQALHGLTPSAARVKGAPLTAYPAVTFALSLKGVTAMHYRIEEKPPFRIVGIKERLSYTEDLGLNVGRMWQELPPATLMELKALADIKPSCPVGAYAEMYADSTTDYYIAAITTAPCPDHLSELDIPSGTWAVFEITGPLPGAMREVWGRIFSEWFPTSGYEHAPLPEIEWYAPGDDMTLSDYKSEIWIPILKK